MNILESTINELVEILSRNNTNTHICRFIRTEKLREWFQTKIVQGRLRKGFLEQEIPTPRFIPYITFTLCLSQCTIYHK